MKELIEINPNILKEAIVEVRFISDYRYETLLGLFFDLFETNGYNVEESEKNDINLSFENKIIPITLSPSFTKDDFRIKLTPRNFVFNIIGEYPLWPIFFQKIKEALNIIFSSKLINSFNRVGVRYVNMVENENIFNKIQQSIRVKIDNYTTKSTKINTVIHGVDYIANLNIGNDFKVKNKSVSLVDIDVIFESKTSLNNDELIFKIDQLHSREKEIFLSILRPDYLNSLNPKFNI